MRKAIALILALALSACAAPVNEPTASTTAAPTASSTAAPIVVEPTTSPASEAVTTAPAPTTAPAETTAAATAASAPETTTHATVVAQNSAPAETNPPEKQTVFLTISCKIALESGKIDADKVEILPENGIILRVEAELQDGDTVFDLLQRECRAARVHMEFVKTPASSTAYVEGIGNLYELDGGELSGWVFKVNGEWPGRGSGNFALAPGDEVEWLYTCDLGRDVGAPDAELGG